MPSLTIAHSDDNRMKINIRALALWGVYFFFVAYAVATHWQETTLRFDVPLGGAKLLIFLHGGPTTALIWLIPTLAFANLSILLYVALNFDSIASTFLGS